MVGSVQSEREFADCISEAASAGSGLRVVGGGTRAGLGRPLTAKDVLSTAGYTGITLYEPSEMVIGARAGTPVAEIERTLAGEGQMLAFEPMDHRGLYGQKGEPTIGAVAACNLSGSRRVAAGACRDSLIGVRFVNGRGEIIKNGGRVMKNVTGLDLVKLQSGAFGTLGLLTEVTFRVIPRAPVVATLEIQGLDDATAVKALAAALTSPFEPTGAAHLPRGLSSSMARTLLRIEGLEEQIRYRSEQLRQRLAPFGALQLLPADDNAIWRSLSDGLPVAGLAGHAVWRLSVKATEAAAVVERIAQKRDIQHYYDWGGGLIWLATDESDLAGAAEIRAAVGSARGHATLVRGSDALRQTIDVFHPLSPPLMLAQRGVKRSFDPHGILNAGRMYKDF